MTESSFQQAKEAYRKARLVEREKIRNLLRSMNFEVVDGPRRRRSFLLPKEINAHSPTTRPKKLDVGRRNVTQQSFNPGSRHTASP